MRHNTGAGFELTWQVGCIAAAVALLLATATRADPDLWGHVRFGLDWLHSHRLPSVDPYSFTQDRAWINHEWLSEVATAAAFAVAGSAGIVALKTGVVCLAIAIVWYRLRGCSTIVASSIALASLAAALPVTATARPQIWSLLGLTLTMVVLDARVDFSRRLLWLGLLFAAWANLHGGWITGLAAVGAYTATRWLRGRVTLPRAALTIAAAAAATLLNPYGVTLWRFLASTVRTARPDISEWQPFTLHEPVIMWVAVLFPIVLLTALSSNKKGRPSAEVIVTTAVLIAAGLRVSRVAPLVCPAVAAALGPFATSAWSAAFTARAASRAGALVLLAPAVPLWITAVGFVAQTARCLPVRDTWMPDIEAARRLEGATGRLWVAFDWGEYAIWHVGPALAVSIDGRRETVYSQRIIQMHRDFDQGLPEARSAFLRWSPEYVWLRPNAGTQEWLLAHGYRMLVKTDRSFVAARSDVTPPNAEATAPAESCFP